MNKSYGFVEVQGLALAVTVADAMVKSANVELVDAARANGGGWIQVRVAGDVGAVQAAVEVGCQVAKQHGVLVSHRVISRPAEDLVKMLKADAASGTAKKEAPKAEIQAPVSEQKDVAAPSASAAPKTSTTRKRTNTSK